MRCTLLCYIFPFGGLLSQSQLNHNSTKPNKTKVGLDTKMTSHHPPTRPPPTKQTQCQQYLSCSCFDFNNTLKVGFWDQQQQQEQEQQQ